MRWFKMASPDSVDKLGKNSRELMMDRRPMACCGSWSRKESDVTELNYYKYFHSVDIYNMSERKQRIKTSLLHIFLL